MGWLRRSLMLRALFIQGTLLMLAVIAAIYGVTEIGRRSAEEGLAERATLMSRVLAGGAADALWNIDTRQGTALLESLVGDPDYVGGTIFGETGQVFASQGGTEGDIRQRRPIIRDGKTIGTIEVRLSRVRADGAVRENSILIGLAGAAALAVMLLSLAAVLRSVTGPVRQMTRVMTDLAERKADVAVPALERVDEIGRMARAVAIFKQNLDEIDRLNFAQEALRQEAMNGRRRLVEDMAANFEQRISSVTRQVSTMAEAVSAGAAQLARNAGGAMDATRQAAQLTDETAANVQTVAAAAEQLDASIREISSRVGESAQIATNGASKARSASDTVNMLAGQAQRIGSIVQLINDIAGQTNLLALNATIEAARAGDAGRGFAIVAAEVKNLATQTAQATEEIVTQVNAIQNAAGLVVADIREIAETATLTREISAGIAAAVEQQGAATREISRSIGHAASGTQAVSGSVSVVTESVVVAGQEARNLAGHVRDLNSRFAELDATVRSFAQDVRAA